MAICVGYFQEDHTHAGTVTVAGYVSPKARWRFFDERWPRALRAEGLTAFNGLDYIRSTGEFAQGWHDDESRRARLISTLARLTQQHVLLGFSCSLPLDDYEAVNRDYRFAETAGGPYGVCAGCVMVRVQRWMAEHHPEDLTLFVFEDGDVDHREIRRILVAEGIDKGEPVQLWPRRWKDERGRQRFLRPFEACDLLIPECESGMPARLAPHASWEHELIDRGRLSQICQVLAVERRSATIVDGQKCSGFSS